MSRPLTIPAGGVETIILDQPHQIFMESTPIEVTVHIDGQPYPMSAGAWVDINPETIRQFREKNGNGDFPVTVTNPDDVNPITIRLIGTKHSFRKNIVEGNVYSLAGLVTDSGLIVEDTRARFEGRAGVIPSAFATSDSLLGATHYDKSLANFNNGFLKSFRLFGKMAWLSNTVKNGNAVVEHTFTLVDPVNNPNGTTDWPPKTVDVTFPVIDTAGVWGVSTNEVSGQGEIGGGFIGYSFISSGGGGAGTLQVRLPYYAQGGVIRTGEPYQFLNLDYDNYLIEMGNCFHNPYLNIDLVADDNGFHTYNRVLPIVPSKVLHSVVTNAAGQVMNHVAAVLGPDHYIGTCVGGGNVWYEVRNGVEINSVTLTDITPPANAAGFVLSTNRMWPVRNGTFAMNWCGEDFYNTWAVVGAHYNLYEEALQSSGYIRLLEGCAQLLFPDPYAQKIDVTGENIISKTERGKPYLNGNIFKAMVALLSGSQITSVDDGYMDYIYAATWFDGERTRTVDTGQRSFAASDIVDWGNLADISNFSLTLRKGLIN